jgi:excinuclease ABC subunit C
MPLKNTREVPLAADAGQADGALPRAESGPAVIAKYLKTLPGSPGVYRMIDAGGNVIYVGKARSLRTRVTSYARGGQHTNRIARMIAATTAMEFVTVRTEAEALLLEANLIKRFRPRFNVLLRDDKSFPYILIARDHVAPQILKHRGARNRKGDYFGPFASAGAVNRTINMLERAFLLRSCSDPVFESRTRPCLLFQIKRCSAPCTGEIALQEYGALVEEATRFLKGESQNARQMYQRLMEQAAANLDYEQAAKFRNRLWALAHVTADQAINPEGIEEADVFAAYQEGGQTCIQVFFFRAGQNWGNRAYFPRRRPQPAIEEVLESFIAQFYDDKPVPRLILLSHDLPGVDLLSEALSTKAERKVEVRAPKRGGKTGIVEHATQNAREALGRRLAESSSQRILLDGLRERFDLSVTPRRIEVFDNSHIQGSSAVGAMIVAGPDGFMKSHYRKFNIKSADLTPGDDYAMMREVLTRRFRRLALDEAQAPVSPSANPDRTLRAEGEQGFDPGSGAGALQEVPDHLGASASAFGMTGASTSRIEQPRPPSPQERGADALAFGMLRADANGDAGEVEDAVIEEFRPAGCRADRWRPRPAQCGPGGTARTGHRPRGADRRRAKGLIATRWPRAFPQARHDRSMMLEPRDPVLYFVQRLRDEAHRFAIGTHRAKRAKSIGVNPLDEIAGIGPSRKRALLKHFGSAKAVSRAGREDLQAVDGISAQMAQAIYDFFHERNE